MGPWTSLPTYVDLQGRPIKPSELANRGTRAVEAEEFRRRVDALAESVYGPGGPHEMPCDCDLHRSDGVHLNDRGSVYVWPGPKLDPESEARLRRQLEALNEFRRTMADGRTAAERINDFPKCSCGHILAGHRPGPGIGCVMVGCLCLETGELSPAPERLTVPMLETEPSRTPWWRRGWFDWAFG